MSKIYQIDLSIKNYYFTVFQLINKKISIFFYLFIY